MLCNAKMNYLSKKNGLHLALEANVIYDSCDDYDLHLQIIYPYSCTYKDTFPCLLYVQGSGWQKQPLYTEIPNLCKIAEKGIVIAVVEYRSVDKAYFPAQIIDTKTALRFIKKNCDKYNIDPNRVFLGGNSSGGHTALMAYLTKDNPKFSTCKYEEYDEEVRGVIDWYGPTDFSLVKKEIGNENVVEFSIFEENTNLDEMIKIASPLNYISDRKLVPFLVFHGTADDIVNKKHSDLLVQRLEEYSHNVTYIEMIDSLHGGPEFFDAEALEFIVSFINKNC